jgi:hypothetical protein
VWLPSLTIQVWYAQMCHISCHLHTVHTMCCCLSVIQQVKSLLSTKVQDIDSIIDAVPDLMNPQQLTQSLSNLVAWFPNHDPFELLQQNPQILENPNVEADPTYGKWDLRNGDRGRQRSATG